MTAAQDQIRILKAEQRGWISIKSTAFNYVKDTKGIPRADATIVFSNTGTSPALKVQFSLCTQVRDTEPTVGLRPDKVCEDEWIGLIGKDGEITRETPDMSQSTLENSLAKTSFETGFHLYVWGEVTYETLAKDGRHFTRICLRNGGNQLGPCSDKDSNDAD